MDRRFLVIAAILGSAGCASLDELFTVCGDGVHDPGEECDPGRDATEGCSSSCERLEVVRCGDGVVGTGESCDDGNTVDGDGCSAACATTTCGDGQRQPGERCFVVSRRDLPALASDLAVGDLDGNGVAEAVTAGDELRRFSLAGGVVGPAATIPLPATPVVELADIDGGGDLDLVGLMGGDPLARQIFIARGDGAGGFGAPALLAGGASFDVRALDFDADGDLDLVTLVFSGVDLHENTGGGGFSTPRSVWSAGGRPLAHARFVDLDGDDRPDLVGRRDSGALVTAVHDLAGGLVTVSEISESFFIADFAFLDVNGDGELDALVGARGGSNAGESTYLYRGDGQGGLEFAGLEAKVFCGFASGGVALAVDLDGDGHDDAIVDHARAYLRGAISGLTAWDCLGTTRSSYDSLVAHDIEGDGAVDLIAAGESADDGLGTPRLELLWARP